MAPVGAELSGYRAALAGGAGAAPDESQDGSEGIAPTGEVAPTVHLWTHADPVPRLGRGLLPTLQGYDGGMTTAPVKLPPADDIFRQAARVVIEINREALEILKDK